MWPFFDVLGIGHLTRFCSRCFVKRQHITWIKKKHTQSEKLQSRDVIKFMPGSVKSSINCKLYMNPDTFVMKIL
jgi:hypothetical protein